MTGDFFPKKMSSPWRADGRSSVLEVKNTSNKLLHYSAHSLDGLLKLFVRCLLRAFPKSSFARSFILSLFLSFIPDADALAGVEELRWAVQVESCIFPLPVDGVRSGKNKRKKINSSNQSDDQWCVVCLLDFVAKFRANERECREN